MKHHVNAIVSADWHDEIFVPILPIKHGCKAMLQRYSRILFECSHDLFTYGCCLRLNALMYRSCLA